MTIEERLENMERELGRVKRHNRWVLGAVLLVVGGLIAPKVFETTAIRARAQGAGTAKEIRARKFILEDEKGKTRAWLFVDTNGPALSLLDEKGEIRIDLCVDKDGQSLRMWDEKGKGRARLAVFKDGPALSLFDENSKTRAEVTVGKEGPVLAMFDENTKIRAGLFVMEGSPALMIYDEKEIFRVSVGKIKAKTPDGKIIEYPVSSLVLYGPDGKVIWSAIK